MTLKTTLKKKAKIKNMIHKTILAAMLAVTTLTGTADMLSDVADALDALGPVEMHVRYGVLLPSADDDITYDIDMWAAPAPGDRLSDSDYLIDWRLKTPSGESDGWSAYHAGDHYRYRDGRLQEYHYAWDSIPMIMGGGGVQRNTQFVELTPAALASGLRSMATDSTYSVAVTADTICDGLPAGVIRARQSVNGYDCRYITWVVDQARLMPRKIEIESNPGSISEQTMTIRFDSIAPAEMPGLSEEALIERYPDHFADSRQSIFTLAMLPGKPLPPFSAPTPTGERYTRHKGDAMAAPTLVWVLDAGVATTADVIAQTRRAVDALPMTADVIYAFVTNNADDIETIIGELRPGEHVVMSARSLARDCGVTATPAAVMTDSEGTVTAVIPAYSSNLSEAITQNFIR